MANITSNSPQHVKPGLKKKRFYIRAEKPSGLDVSATVTRNSDKFYRELPTTLDIGGQTYSFVKILTPL